MSWESTRTKTSNPQPSGDGQLGHHPTLSSLPALPLPRETPTWRIQSTRPNAKGHRQMHTRTTLLKKHRPIKGEGGGVGGDVDVEGDAEGDGVVANLLRPSQDLRDLEATLKSPLTLIFRTLR